MGTRNRTHSFQTIDDAVIDRSDHVWAKFSDGRWKCMLCGAIVRVGETPPAAQTPADWMPHTYELPLSEGERDSVRRQKSLFT